MHQAVRQPGLLISRSAEESGTHGGTCLDINIYHRLNVKPPGHDACGSPAAGCRSRVHTCEHVRMSTNVSNLDRISKPCARLFYMGGLRIDHEEVAVSEASNRPGPPGSSLGSGTCTTFRLPNHHMPLRCTETPSPP